MASNVFNCKDNENIMIIDEKVDTSSMKKDLTVGTSTTTKINNINYEIYEIGDKFKMGEFYDKYLKNKQNFNIMDCKEFTKAQPKAQVTKATTGTATGTATGTSNAKKKKSKGGAKKTTMKKTTKIGRGKFARKK